MPTRAEQKQATRAAILEAATALLVEHGYAGYSTAAVQRAAGVSRGALLHHFPTLAELTRALVAHIVERNEATAHAAARRSRAQDPVDRALAALHAVMQADPAVAERELWAAARTDLDLAVVLREAERAAGRDLHRVIDGLFGAELAEHPAYPDVRDLTVTLLRGLAAGQPLHTTAKADQATLRRWADVVRRLLA